MDETSTETIHVNARAIIERYGNAGPEIVLQTRNKAHENTKCLELPGGRVEPYESLFSALKREVQEETGLSVTFIEAQTTTAEALRDGIKVECLRPYAVYQTLEGPVDSMGVYFLCRAEGQLLRAGDEAENASWLGATEVATMLAENRSLFSWVDEAALRFYLREKGLC